MQPGKHVSPLEDLRACKHISQDISLSRQVDEPSEAVIHHVQPSSTQAGKAQPESPVSSLQTFYKISQGVTKKAVSC